MVRGVEWVIDRYPKDRTAIRKLSADESFVELCEHLALMAEAAKTNPDPNKRTRYAELRDQLETELQDYLNLNPQ